MHLYGIHWTEWNEYFAMKYMYIKDLAVLINLSQLSNFQVFF